MERLGRSMVNLSMPLVERHEILCSAAARVASGAGLRSPDGSRQGPVADRVHHDALGSARSSALRADDRPCAGLCGTRIAAHDDERARLVHGDVHQWNALESDDGFKLVDPDGLYAEPEYDLGVIMREDPVELIEEGPCESAHRLASSTALDPTAIWEWGVVERVSTGLLCTDIELQPVGRAMLAAATIVADL